MHELTVENSTFKRSILVSFDFVVARQLFHYVSLLTVCLTSLHFRWYHGRIEREVADKLLMESENDSFLVRESVAHPGDYTITVRCQDSTIMSIHVDYKVL